MLKKWSFGEAQELFNLPFHELIYQAHTIHKKNFNPKKIQVSTLLSIKTGNCPEDCSYCPQSAHFNTGIKKELLIDLAEVIKAAKKAKEVGSQRFCLGAAWRGPRDEDLDKVCEMVREVKRLGMETCVTLGLLKSYQAKKLKDAGLDFYNHNIDTSEKYYKKIITTRSFKDRLETIECIQNAGIKVCCGGILGMGESNEDRINMLLVLANMNNQPESVPINKLVPIPGTPLADIKSVAAIEFVRIIALARIMMPKSYIRLSAGRAGMNDALQALCFFSGVNSIFYGEQLLTTPNSDPNSDYQLFEKLGLEGL